MTEQLPLNSAPLPLKLRVEDYLRLEEANVRVNHGRTELVNGILYEMSPQYRPHWFAKNELTYRLRRSLEEIDTGLYVGSEGSVMLSEFDLPEPDIIVTSEPMGAGPVPLASVRMLIEIADTTAQYDLGAKARLYAGAGVPEYWVMDLGGTKIHQFWMPVGEAYGEGREIAVGSEIAAATISGLRFAIPEI